MGVRTSDTQRTTYSSDTQRTTKVLNYIVGRHRAGRIPPTIREIQVDLGLSSTSVADYHVKKLEHLGLITRERGITRSIQPTEKALQPRDDFRIRIDLPWIPNPQLRGNASNHHMVKVKFVREMRDRGLEYGLVAKQDHPDIDYPIKGPLFAEITAWNPQPVDWDNLAIGYKAFMDGLQRVMKRDEWGKSPAPG